MAGANMATLVNYSVSTFRDHPKPNKRRLQELQHSEARAHAARVAYWRNKKDIRASGPKKPREETSQEGHNVKVAEAGRRVSSRSAGSKVSGKHGCKDDQGIKSRSSSAEASWTGTLVTTSQSSPDSIKGIWRSSSSESSPFSDERDMDGWDDLAEYLRLPQQPKSPLFDPFNSFPCRQGDEVVVAMDHCKALPSPSLNLSDIYIYSHAQLGAFPKTWIEIPDEGQPSDSRHVSCRSAKCGAV